MLDIDFTCRGARPATWAAAPTMLFDIEVVEPSHRRVYGIRLQCQIRAEPVRRRYSGAEEQALSDLFGEPERWGDTLKPIQVSTVSTMVPGFTDSTRFELPVPCTYDTEVAAASYFRALDDGEIPLLLLFSGSVFFAGGEGLLVEQVPWDREVAFRLPVSTWRALMEAHFHQQNMPVWDTERIVQSRNDHLAWMHEHFAYETLVAGEESELEKGPGGPITQPQASRPPATTAAKHPPPILPW